jgi:transcriptional regulator with XRE-family HTH domain
MCNTGRLMAVPGGVQEVRTVFGARLRELRKHASLTGRALAERTGLHFTKVSRVEHGRQGLTDAEIRSWCAACGAPEQAAELIALAREVDSLSREWRRPRPAPARRYDKVRLLRMYASALVPELFRTPAYAYECATQWVRLMGAPDSTARPEPSVLRSGLRRFALVVEEQALRTRVGGPDVMVEQLDHLLDLSTLPRISLGVVPAMAERSFVSQVPFWIWDDTRVTIETIGTDLEVTRRDEVAVYIAAFDAVRQSAVYGTRAAELIAAARSDFAR